MVVKSRPAGVKWDFHVVKSVFHVVKSRLHAGQSPLFPGRRRSHVVRTPFCVIRSPLVAPSPPLEREFREVCPACRRPVSVCYCAHVTQVPTRTRVVVLQHPRERDMPIGTARMATLCLPNAELHEGVCWDDAALGRVLSDPDRTPILLYPGPGSLDVMTHPPEGPVTLVVVDGTWWQAKKLVRENPRLRALPRYAFTPPRPSEYRIRKEPEEAYVSTLEALVHVLGALEGDPARFEALLRPFRAMIDGQIARERAMRGAGARHAQHAAKRARTRRLRVPPLLRSAENLVCIAGEANAWPYCARQEGHTYEDELVHWTACRVGSGETFERVVAPRFPLAPRTTKYIELEEHALRQGGTMAELAEAWRGFLREDDVLCFWGHYAGALFVRSGGVLPDKRVDLRAACRDYGKTRVGTLEEHALASELVVQEPQMPGRAGQRLSKLRAIAERFVQLAAAEAE